MDTSDWRDQLQPETRQLNFNKIMDTLKTHHSSTDEDGLLVLQQIAQCFEEKTYASATSQSDYLEKIAFKMLLMGEASDWRVQLQLDSRQRIVNRIMDTLKRHLPVSGPEGLHELWKIAQRFEEKIFTAATSQSDYLRKISLKMLTMESKSQGYHGQPSNQFGPDNKPADPEASDWRVQLQLDSRQRIVNRIVDTLRRHRPVSGGLPEIRRIAQRFEEKIYIAATSQSDYLRKISLKMLTMETKSQGLLGQPSNQFVPYNKPADPADANLRKQSNRSKRRPTWTRDYHMG